MMEILKIFGGFAILVLMPILYIGGIILMLMIARWLYMFIGVITGDKSVIEEFDCSKKKSFWDKLMGRYDQKQYRPPPGRPRHWRGGRR